MAIKIEKFKNVRILNANEMQIEPYELKKEKLKYGLGEELENEVYEKTNSKIKLNLNKKASIQIYNDFSQENTKLIDIIEINCQKRSKS